jgi:hypothetical protein
MRIIGWACFGVAAFYAIRLWWLDRRLQTFRAAGARGSAFLFVPVRWQDELYTTEGRPLITSAWRSLGAMAMWFVVGAVSILLGA